VVCSYQEQNFAECLVTVKNSFVFSSIITKNIQKALRTMMLRMNTYKSLAGSDLMELLVAANAALVSFTCISLNKLSRQ